MGVTSDPPPRGFTLLEILVALGILAFGLTVAIGLLALAATTHKRAVDKVNAALVAESVFADLASAVTLSFDETRLPLYRPEDGEEGAGDRDTRILVEEAHHPDYPGYRYTVYLTPLEPGPPPADAFLAEIWITWAEKGERRQVVYQTVLLRRLAERDLE